MKRLFVAVKIIPNDIVIELLTTLKNDLAGEKIQWVNPENMHITLKFFGDIPDKDIPAIEAMLEKASGYSDAITFSLAELGNFGSSRFPRVIWLGTKGAENLSALYDTINELMKPLGYQPDKPFFIPHLTLGRIKDIKHPEILYSLEAQYNEMIFQEVKIDKLILFHSRLRPQGPIYTALNTFDLIRR